MNKDTIRTRVKARKSMLTARERDEAAMRVFAALERTAAFLMADNILMYRSLPDELSTRDFIYRWAARKHFYLPRVNGVDLDILPYDRSRLHLGTFNIEEPDGDDTTDIDAIDLIVVPAVAYDRRGNRIGRGKGYYDRLLRRSRATTVGVAYACQICDDIEPDDFDVPVHFVITEEEIIRPR